MISIDINLTNLNLMTQCVWTVGISHGPQKRDEADCRSESTGNPLLSNFMLLKIEKTVLGGGICGGAKEANERRRKRLEGGETAAGVDPCEGGGCCRPLLPFQVAFLMDGPISWE